MKRFPILVIAVLSIVLVQSDLAQTKGSPNNSDPSIQTKPDKKVEKAQDKKLEKAKVKAAKATSKVPSGDNEKNATSAQDAAYAAAYKSGTVKP